MINAFQPRPTAVNRLSYLLMVSVVAAFGGCYPMPTSSASTGNIPSYDELQDRQKVDETDKSAANQKQKQGKKVKTATFGAGCFWCVEAVFQELDGVHSVKSGYTGGHVDNPTYEQICTGRTGHAEVCLIKYDPEKITFKELLEVFWMTHDPTTLNRQGVDTGTQYRSAVFYHDEEQKRLSEKYKNALNEQSAFGRPIITEIVAAETFYPCEKYHDNYFKDNPNAGYCRAIIRPKMKKFRKAFAEKLKKDDDQ
jgi:peptide-methionine (S)-S-oxide reductase